MTKRSVGLGKWWPWEVVTVMAACLLHRLCFGARSLVFFHVKWLQAAMKGTLCVRRLGAWIVSSIFNQFSLCVLQRVDANRFAMAAWMCAWCCKTHCNGCMNVACGLFSGGSRSTKPCVFFRGKWLQAAIAVWIGSGVIGFPLVLCNVWMQIALKWLHGCVRVAAKRILMAA